MTKELFDFDVTEVSFVTKGANKKKRHIVKSEDGVSESLLKALEKIEEYDVAGIKAAIKKSMDEMGEIETETDADAISLVEAAFALLMMAKDKLPKNIELGMRTEGTSAYIYKANDTVVLKGENDRVKAEVEKALEQANELHLQKVSELEKSLAEAIEKSQTITPSTKGDTMSDNQTPSTEAAPVENERILKAEEEVRSLRELVQKMEDDKAEAAYINKAEKELPLVGKSDDLGKLLFKIHKSAGKDTADEVEKILKSLNGQISEGNTFKEIGSSASGSADDKEAAVIAKAEEIFKSGKAKTLVEARGQARLELLGRGNK